MRPITLLSGLKIVILAGLILTLFSTGYRTVAAPEDASAVPIYVLGPEDSIEINVWTHTDLTRTVTVREDGRIAFPPIGEVKAAGLTPEQLARSLRQSLQQYVRNRVVIFVPGTLRYAMEGLR